MSGLFNTLNTASKGMMASQTSLHTTGHNISNANTPGYSRQRVELKADLPYSFAGVGQLGTGVKMDSVIRIVNDYVSKQIRQEGGTLEEFSAKLEIMEQIEVIFNEPSDTSLNSNIGKMFDAWIELSKNPEVATSKTIVVEESESLANTYNHMVTQLGHLEEESHGMIERNIEDFNSDLEKLEALNKQIFNAAVKGGMPNDLLDTRDQILRELSGKIDINVDADKYGRVSVTTGGENLLVAGKSASKLLYEKNVDNPSEGSINIVDKEGNKLEIKPTKGEIKGRFNALEELAERKEEMFNFAKGLSDAINTVHKEGIEVDKQIDIFEFDQETGRLKVNEKLDKDSSLLVTGRDLDSPVGDNSRALLISNLRNINIKFGQDDIGDIVKEEDGQLVLNSQAGGNAIGGYYNKIVTNVGISQQHAESMVENQEVLLGQLDLRRESVSGVSMDEEITDLIRFSSAFDANARVIQTLSDMLDTLIHRTGV